MATLNKEVLTLTEYDWSGTKKSFWTLKQVEKLVDMSIGAVLSGGLEQPILLVKRAGLTEQYIVDLESNSYIKETLADSELKNRLLIKDEDNNGLLDIFRFNLNGGDFGVYNSRGNLIKKITLPKLNGIFGA